MKSYDIKSWPVSVVDFFPEGMRALCSERNHLGCDGMEENPYTFHISLMTWHSIGFF